MTEPILFDLATRDQVSGPIICDWCGHGKHLRVRGGEVLCYHCRVALEDAIAAARTKRTTEGIRRRRKEEAKR